MYVKGKVLKQQFGVSTATLRKWANSGRIKAITMPESGQRLFDSDSVKAMFKDETVASVGRKSYIYARVSSEGQKNDLERQIEDLKNAFPNHIVIQDIGSGLNFRRPGLQKLLERVCEGLVEEVAVMHKDRLCRFATELLEFLFEANRTKLVVHRNEESPPSPTQELSEDLISIVTVFVARHNGRRSGENRKRRKEEADQKSASKETKRRKESPRKEEERRE
jgi:predicted site-specific integrase-resolvase